MWLIKFIRLSQNLIFLKLIFLATAIGSFSYRRIVATTLSPLYQLGHQSTLALSRVEILHVADYLQTNAFPDLVVMKQEEYPHALQKKVIRKATSKVVRETASRMQPGLTLRTLTLASTIHPTPWWVGVTAE